MSRGGQGGPFSFLFAIAVLGLVLVGAGAQRARAQQGPLVLSPPPKAAVLPLPSSGAAPKVAPVVPALPPTAPLPAAPSVRVPSENLDKNTPATPLDAPSGAKKITAPSGIQADVLGQINPETVGVLDQANGGFGVNLWQGTPRSLVETLISALPNDARSAEVRALIHRLMLTRALAPVGESLDAGVSLLARRITVLASMGDIPGATRLIDAIPGRAADEKINRIEADIRLLNGDNARACALAEGAVGTKSGDQDYWRKALIFCQALTGKAAAAALGVSLLREQQVEAPVFYALMDGFAAQSRPKLTTLKQPTALVLAMARAFNVALPEDVTASGSPAILRTLSSSPNAPLDVRLDSAERASRIGVLQPAELRQIYESVTFSQDALASPLSRAEKKRGAWSRALLYRAALNQTIPSARAETLARALKLGREDGRYGLTARTFAPLIAGLDPSSTLSWFAPGALRALIVAGRGDAARRWLAFMRAKASLDPAIGKTLTAMMPIVRLSGIDQTGLDAGRLDQRWWSAVRKGPHARARASMLYALLAGMGEDIPVSLWRTLLPGPARLNVAAMQAPLAHALDDAAKAGRVGETVLLSVLAIGAENPADLNPMDMERIVAALKSVGLEQDGRKLALEAMLALAP